jgi:hypothetical protein
MLDLLNGEQIRDELDADLKRRSAWPIRGDVLATYKGCDSKHGS